VPKGALRTHSAEQTPLWGSLVTCVVYVCACASVRALVLCFCGRETQPVGAGDTQITDLTCSTASARLLLTWNLAFTRYCHYQYCMVPCIQEGDRGGTIHCAILFVRKIQGAKSRRRFGLLVELPSAQSQKKETKHLQSPTWNLPSVQYAGVPDCVCRPNLTPA